jgi:hypothetical protein
LPEGQTASNGTHGTVEDRLALRRIASELRELLGLLEAEGKAAMPRPK